MNGTTQQRTAIKSRGARVVKRTDKTPADYQRDHEIALLKLLAKKHPEITATLTELVIK